MAACLDQPGNPRGWWGRVPYRLGNHCDTIIIITPLERERNALNPFHPDDNDSNNSNTLPIATDKIDRLRRHRVVYRGSPQIRIQHQQWLRTKTTAGMWKSPRNSLLRILRSSIHPKTIPSVLKSWQNATARLPHRG